MTNDYFLDGKHHILYSDICSLTPETLSVIPLNPFVDS